jgi:cell division protein FtsB
MLSILRKGFWLFGIGILLLVVFLPGFSKLQELRDKNRDMTEKIKRLIVENSLLQEELKLVKDDPVYQEKIAREKLGVVRKGEVPIRVIPEQKKR